MLPIFTSGRYKMPKVILIALTAGVCFLSSLVVAEEQSVAYRLHAGDSMFISVWKEEALQREVRVLPDGSVTFPLAGRVDVAGASVSDVAQRLSSKLKEFLPEPVVTVVVTGIEGNRVYVLGKVNKPGPMVLQGPTSVLQALSIAGGLDKFADEKGIKVIRDSGDGMSQVLPVDFRELSSGKSLTTNFRLVAGDTLLVP